MIARAQSIFICFFVFLFASGKALAAGINDTHEIPTVILYQAINLGLLLALMHFLLRKKMLAYFADRQKSYLEARSKALELRHKAEQRHSDIAKRLSALTTSTEQTIEEARREAELLRINLINEAQIIARRMRDEAQRTARYELEKAVTQLRQTMIDEAVSRARSQLSKLGDSDQRALHREFVDKIQAVQ